MRFQFRLCKSSTVKIIRASDPKMSSSAAFAYMLIGPALDLYYKGSKVLIFITSAVTRG